MRCLEIEAYRMKEFVISEAQTEKAVLVGLVTQTQNERKTNEYLDELAFLAETAGAEVVKRFTQKLDTPNSVTYVVKENCRKSENISSSRLRKKRMKSVWSFSMMNCRPSRSVILKMN